MTNPITATPSPPPMQRPGSLTTPSPRRSVPSTCYGRQAETARLLTSKTASTSTAMVNLIGSDRAHDYSQGYASARASATSLGALRCRFSTCCSNQDFTTLVSREFVTPKLIQARQPSTVSPSASTSAMPVMCPIHPARLPVVRRSLQDRDGERSAGHGRPTRELDSLDND